MIDTFRDDSLKNKVIEIIKTYMGETMSQMYSKFYENKEQNLILNSINELLVEHVGPQKAKEILSINGLHIEYGKN